MDYNNANSFNLDSYAFADVNVFMRHSSITTVPHPVDCDRRHGNLVSKQPTDSGVSPNIQICHACLQVSVLCSIWHLQRSADNNDESTQQQIPKKGSSSIKILSMNCKSIKGNIKKNCEFRALLQQHDRHVILGCEFKINSTFPTYNLFPPHYTDVHRKDCTKHGGVVFFCCNQWRCPGLRGEEPI